MKPNRGSGDDGTTSTIANERVKKFSYEIELYGALDSAIAMAGAMNRPDIQEHLHKTFAMMKKKEGGEK